MSGLKSGQSSLSFSWSSVPGATAYHFFLGRPSPAGAALVVVEKEVSTTTCSVPGSLLLVGEVYAWSVTASADGQEDQKSVPFTFSVYKSGSPEFGSCASSAATVCWRNVPGATKYLVRVYEGSKISPGNEHLTETMWAGDTEYVTQGFFKNSTTYCGYVTAMRGDYVIGISGTFMFTYIR
jgi:hypothetical protein